MKKLLILLCAISLSLYNPTLTYAQSILNTTKISSNQSITSPWPADAPAVNSQAAIVVEASTGAILYSKNIHDTFYPASITKVLTALIAIENSSMGETVTFSKEAIFDVDLDSSRIGIDVGEQLTMEQSLYAILLESANEVSYGIAEHIAGDVESFAKLMNAKATELGCTDSNFVNPHGLPDPNHYTSAYDMSLIARAAINNSTFREITGSRTYVIPPTNIQEETRYLANHHKFIKNKSSFDECIGGKTGYTTKAKYTLVTFAERNGVTLISIILSCDNIQSEYSDTSSLLNYGFENYTLYNIADIEEPQSADFTTLFTKYSSLFSATNSQLQLSPNGNIILPNGATSAEAEKEIILSPISSVVAGANVIGSINYTYEGAYVGSTDVIFNNISTPSLIKDLFIPTPTPVEKVEATDKTEQPASESNNMKPIIIGVLVGVVVLVLGLYFVLIEMPLHKRRNAYHKKKSRRHRSTR